MWTACWRTLTGGFCISGVPPTPTALAGACRPPAFYLREDYPPAWRDAVQAVIDAPGFYRQLPVMAGAQAALAALAARGYRLTVCTRPAPRWPSGAPGWPNILARHWLKACSPAPTKPRWTAIG